MRNLKATRLMSAMTTADWKRLLLRLQWYAFSVSRPLRWRTGAVTNNGALPNGETVDSIVSKAIEKVLSGERDWNPDERPDLAKYLMDVIDSLLSHLFESKDNEIFTRTRDYDDEGGELPEWEYEDTNREVGPETAWLCPIRFHPEDTLIQQEEAEFAGRAVQMILEGCADDPLLIEMVRLMGNGVLKSRDLAAALAVPVGAIYNATKRLDRKYLEAATRIREEIGLETSR